jgi:hypothetical protein
VLILSWRPQYIKKRVLTCWIFYSLVALFEYNCVMF